MQEICHTKAVDSRNSYNVYYVKFYTIVSLKGRLKTFSDDLFDLSHSISVDDDGVHAVQPRVSFRRA